METQSKETFKAISRQKIAVNNYFVRALYGIKDIAATYDGKKINKRFIDKVNDTFKLSGLPVTISFDISYKGERQNRFRMFCSDRAYSTSRGNFDLSYDQATTIVCPEDYKKPYMDEDEFRFNYANFVETVTREVKAHNEQIKALNEAVEGVDEAIAIYAELKAIAMEKMNSIPSLLRTRVDIQCPVY